MYQSHWNQLEPGKMVFDEKALRATTLFGRFTNAAYTWYQAKPEWEMLVADPDPVDLQKAGYGYLYLDEGYWDQIGAAGQAKLQAPCVKLVEQVGDELHFRRLYDVNACR
jgi:hypothetical protein